MRRVGSDAGAIADECTGLYSAPRRAGVDDAAHESVALMGSSLFVFAEEETKRCATCDEVKQSARIVGLPHICGVRKRHLPNKNCCHHPAADFLLELHPYPNAVVSVSPAIGRAHHLFGGMR